MELRIATLLLCACTPRLAAQAAAEPFAARTYVSPAGIRMPYRLFVPEAGARRESLPLIIYLHGSGGAGTDNLLQISGGNTRGTHLWVRPDLQARHPAFVVAPQAPEAPWGIPEADSLGTYAQLVVQLIHVLAREFPIDTSRIYLTGQSRGGIGVWDLVSKRPDLFAAGVPLCGAGSPARVGAARNVSIWAFHGAQDQVVPVEGSRELIAGLRAVGAAPRYTEYADVDHAVWNRAYEEKELPEWLFSQRRAPRN